MPTEGTSASQRNNLSLGESLPIWRGIGGISQGRGRQDIRLGEAGDSEQKTLLPFP